MARIPQPLLESLQSDLLEVGFQLKEIARQVIQEDISEYPVFIASQTWIDIGKPVFDRDLVQLNWFFYASILEDFIKRKIVLPSNLLQFKRTYGDPMLKACIFVITEEEAGFVFVPYENEE